MSVIQSVSLPYVLGISTNIVLLATYPEMLPGQAIKCKSGGTLRKDSLIQGDVSLQDQSVCFPLSIRWRAKMQCSSGVGSAVAVLSARIAKIDGVGIDSGTVSTLGTVMNDRSAISE